MPLKRPLALRETSSSSPPGAKPSTGSTGVSSPLLGYPEPSAHGARHEMTIDRRTVASASALTTIGSSLLVAPP